MSVIAVEGFPLNVSLKQATYMLATAIRGNFKALNFVNSDCGTFKTCYLQLSDLLNSRQVIGRINNMGQGNMNVLNAFVPEAIPDVPAKPLLLRKAVRKRLGIEAGDLTPAQVLSIAHVELMTELQYKYTRLCNISSKSSHMLLTSIGKTVYDRLEQLPSGNEDVPNPVQLTHRYRIAYPHVGDFKLIQDTMHRLEDAAGTPRTQLQMTDLIALKGTGGKMIINGSSGEQAAISMFTTRIVKRLQQYMSRYDLTSDPEDSKEVVARKNIRTQLFEFMPHLPAVMKELTLKHFTQGNTKRKPQRMRIYGEPYLPSEAATQKLLKRYGAQHFSPQKTMYNLLLFDVPLKSYPKIMELDGKCLGGSKIVIRPGTVNMYRFPVAKKNVTSLTEPGDGEEPDCSTEH